MKSFINIVVEFPWCVSVSRAAGMPQEERKRSTKESFVTMGADLSNHRTRDRSVTCCDVLSDESFKANKFKYDLFPQRGV
jgi:hypothetical protein